MLGMEVLGIWPPKQMCLELWSSFLKLGQRDNQHRGKSQRRQIREAERDEFRMGRVKEAFTLKCEITMEKVSLESWVGTCAGRAAEGRDQLS